MSGTYMDQGGQNFENYEAQKFAKKESSCYQSTLII